MSAAVPTTLFTDAHPSAARALSLVFAPGPQPRLPPAQPPQRCSLAAVAASHLVFFSSFTLQLKSLVFSSLCVGVCTHGHVWVCVIFF